MSLSIGRCAVTGTDKKTARDIIKREGSRESGGPGMEG
jgi:hypothetical protein